MHLLLLVGTRDLWPVGKGREKKKKNPGINPGQVRRLHSEPAGKGRKKKKKKKKNPGQPTGPQFQDLDLRTWVSGPQSQDLGFRTQTNARNASYGRLIFFLSFSASIVTFLFPVT